MSKLSSISVVIALVCVPLIFSIGVIAFSKESELRVYTDGSVRGGSGIAGRVLNWLSPVVKGTRFWDEQRVIASQLIEREQRYPVELASRIGTLDSEFSRSLEAFKKARAKNPRYWDQSVESQGGLTRYELAVSTRSDRYNEDLDRIVELIDKHPERLSALIAVRDQIDKKLATYN